MAGADGKSMSVQECAEGYRANITVVKRGLNNIIEAKKLGKRLGVDQFEPASSIVDIGIT